jgi:hypothetical protein
VGLLAPTITAITTCATVPTSISVSAVDILSQMASSVASSARPTQTAKRFRLRLCWTVERVNPVFR